MTAPPTQRRRVTQRFPALIPARMAQRRLTKRAQDARAGYRYSAVRSAADLPWLIAEHSSILERDLQGVDPQLQRNKVTNLRLAAGRIDGVLMSPGETFSFWRLVGRATERGGYTDGLVLRDGAAASGVGGGLCQISNMLHWLTLHSELTVVERHRHSFDPFPDSERRVPFGTGATLLDGIFDLKVTNGTAIDHQFRLRLTDTQLVGELRAARARRTCATRWWSATIGSSVRAVRCSATTGSCDSGTRSAMGLALAWGPIRCRRSSCSPITAGSATPSTTTRSADRPRGDQPSRAWPMYSPGWTPRGTANSAEPMGVVQMFRTSDFARRSWIGTNCTAGSAWYATKMSPASAEPSAAMPSS